MLVTRFPRGLALVFMAIFVSGCASSYSMTSKRPAVKPGSYLQLHHEYQVPNQVARIYFRKGKQTAQADVDRFTPYCYLVIQDDRQAGEPQQKIYPGRFFVTEVIESNELIGGRKVYVAGMGWDFDDGPSNINFILEMRLRSTEQPGVRALVCINNSDDYFDRRYPYLSEIKEALGELITIEPPEK